MSYNDNKNHEQSRNRRVDYRDNNNRHDNRNNRQRLKRVAHPNPAGDVGRMGRFGIKIIRNIARGNFKDFEIDRLNFENPQFVKAVMDEVDLKLVRIGIRLEAVKFAYANSTHPEVKNVIMEEQKNYNAYTILKQILFQIQMTGDISYLNVVGSKLASYKHNI